MVLKYVDVLSSVTWYTDLGEIHEYQLHKTRYILFIFIRRRYQGFPDRIMLLINRYYRQKNALQEYRYSAIIFPL